MIHLAVCRLGHRHRVFAAATVLACAGIGCIRADEPLLHAGSGDLDHLGPAPVLPHDVGAVNEDLDGEATCGDDWLPPTLRIETPRGGLRISHLMNMQCGEKPTFDVTVHGDVVKIVEGVTADPEACKCSRAVHAAVRLDPGPYTVEIIRADQHRLLAKEQVEVPTGEPEEF